MNNRKIKAFLLIACIINLTITNCIPVYATVPGVVEAENVWLTLETLALTMGVNLPFIPEKSILYNNNQKKQEMIDYIDNELSQGVITQQQHDDAIQQLDNMLLYPGEHGVGSSISIGAQLWSCLSRYFYANYISVSPDLVSNLSASNKAIFDSYSGTCAIYAVCSQYGASETILCVLSPLALASPYKFGSYDSASNFQSWVVAEGNYNDNFQILTNNNAYRGYINGDGQFFVRFSGEHISVQYIANKIANEVITSNDGENSLVSYPTYNDYTDGLNNVYSISNGQVVVTDTGEAPIVLDGDTIADTVADIQDGITSWENAIPAIQAAEGDTTGDITGENSVIGKKALNELVTGLNVSQIQNKFPFCIPNDLKQIATGAANVSGNAPVIVVPLKLEFAGHTYYDNDEAVVVDLGEFSQLALIFRKGFLLLFLIGMIYLSIYVVSSFFHITE